MAESTTETASGYGKLIEEVFIKPIRTVMVVDDEFPTLEALLDEGLIDKGVDGSHLRWNRTELERARNTIRLCRDPQRRWMVELHDGLCEIDQTSAHFHHSDLLILDYHLNRDKPNDGSDAIGVLRGLANNDHFNLVIVYTKGYEESGGDIARVVQEVALGLCSADDRLNMPKKSQDAARKFLEEWEDHRANIAGEIEELVDEGIYLKVRNLPQGSLDWSAVCSWPQLQGLKAMWDAAPEEIRSAARLTQLAKWALHRRQQALGEKLAPASFGAVGMNWDVESGANWIRTDKLFVTVVSKTNEPSALPGKLLTALQLWNPEPHRLLMSKMRAELDEKGVLAEGVVLENRCLQAGWLGEFLTTDKDERIWKIHNTVDRHWEGLGDEIRGGVSEFAERLAVHLITEGRSRVIQSRYPSLDPIDVSNHLNRYVSSKPAVEGCHLTTGHVLWFDNCNNYWLCLSPACDLVPGQKKSGWPGRLGEHIPFISVQLYKVTKEEALSRAFGGNHLFLEVRGKLECFSFTPPTPAEGSAEIERAANPKWEQMFAARQGRFDLPNRALTISRTSGNEGQLRFDPVSARVVAQLRYEYAINLLHRLGANLSRVGLDFVGISDFSGGDE